MQKFTVMYIPMSDKKFKEFTRYIIRPADCVINALQLAGFIGSDVAELLRITAGNVGFDDQQIESIFSWITRQGGRGKYIFKYKAYPFQEHRKVAQILAEIPLEHAIFAGIRWKSTCMKHAVLICKAKDGSLFIVDPQIKNPIVSDISDYLNVSVEFRVLKYTQADIPFSEL